MDASASAEDNLVGEAASLDTRPEIDDIYSRSSPTSPYDGTSWRMVEYTCNDSFARRTRLSGPTGGNSSESPARQLRLYWLGWVGDPHLEGLLLEGSASDMMDDCSSKREDRGAEWESSEPTLRVYSQPYYNRASLCEGVNEIATDAINRDHPKRQLPPLPSHRHSKVSIRSSTCNFVLCQRSYTSDKVKCRM